MHLDPDSFPCVRRAISFLTSLTKSIKAEQVIAHFGEELKKRYTCKGCGSSGLEGLA